MDELDDGLAGVRLGRGGYLPGDAGAGFGQPLCDRMRDGLSVRVDQDLQTRQA